MIAKPSNTLIFLASRSFKDDESLNMTTRYFLVNYSSEPIGGNLKKGVYFPSIANNGLLLDIPAPNSLIPTNFDIAEMDDLVNATDHPILIKDWIDGQVWLKRDTKFNHPKAFVSLKIYTTDLDFSRTQRSYTFVNVWKIMVEDYIREYLYQGTTASLEFSQSEGAWDHLEY